MEFVDAGTELPNDPEDNPCFACGPRNPVGLRMRFFDDGKVVRSTLTLDERYGGGHDHLLQGILYIAMDDALYWTAWARLGELPAMATDGPTLVRFLSYARPGVPIVVEVERVGDHGDLVDLRARVLQAGRECAVMGWSFRRRTRAEIEDALKRPALERSLREELEATLARR